MMKKKCVTCNRCSCVGIGLAVAKMSAESGAKGQAWAMDGDYAVM